MLTKLEWPYHIHSQHNFVITAGINTSTWCWGTTRESNALTLPHSEQQFLYAGNPFYLHLCKKSVRKAKVRLKFVSWYWWNAQKSRGEYWFFCSKWMSSWYRELCMFSQGDSEERDWSPNLSILCDFPKVSVGQKEPNLSTHILLFFTWCWRVIFFPSKHIW